MGKRGPKARAGLARESNGRVSRRNIDMHIRGDKTFAGWVIYFATAAGLTKVGYSGDVDRRLYMIGWDRGANLRLTGVVAAASEEDARGLEKLVHERLKRLGFHFNGEWFDMDDKDVAAELGRLKADGRVILCGIDGKPAEHSIYPRHEFSDAKGRKFAGAVAVPR